MLLESPKAEIIQLVELSNVQQCYSAAQHSTAQQSTVEWWKEETKNQINLWANFFFLSFFFHFLFIIEANVNERVSVWTNEEASIWNELLHQA